MLRPSPSLKCVRPLKSIESHPRVVETSTFLNEVVFNSRLSTIWSKDERVRVDKHGTDVG